MKRPLLIATGAPGAGKSTAAAALPELGGGCAAFDSDWLIEPAAALAQRDIYADPATWPPYNRLWFAVLRAAYANGQTPVWFAPVDPDDLARAGLPAWCSGVEWLLLDCGDAVRLRRLRQRAGWDEGRIGEALGDAAVLREAVARRIDTGALPPAAVARAIGEWVEGIQAGKNINGDRGRL